MRRRAPLAVGVALIAVWLAPPARAVSVSVPCGDTVAFQAAVNAANAAGGPSVINLAAYCTYTFTTPAVGLTALPIVTANITINGNNATLARALSTPTLRFFYVAGSGTLRLNDVTLQGGTADVGGGVYLEPNAHMTTANATFRGNSTTLGGGAIFGDLPTNLTINTSLFDSNQTAIEGGAIATSGVLKIASSRIINNHAHNTFDTLGGGLFIGGGTADISSTEFRDNFATGSNSGTGGAIFNLGTLRLSSVQLLNNTAEGLVACACLSGFGGGLYNAGTTTAPSLVATGNRARGASDALGGGLGNDGILTLNGGRLDGNTVSGGGSKLGGAVGNSAGSTTLTGVSVIGNSAAGGNGGGLYELGGAVVLNGGQVIFNTPNNCGPAAAIPGCTN